MAFGAGEASGRGNVALSKAAQFGTLPTINGVGPSVIVLPENNANHWQTILDFLDARFPNVSRDDIVARMLRGDVRTENGDKVLPDQPYCAQQKLFYYRHVENEPRVPFDETVLFEDEWIVAADKPHFLPVTPGGRFVQETLLVRLKRKLGIDSLAPMHRIDRETAGVVLFTKQPATRGAYQRQFTDKTVVKHYEAIAPRPDDLYFPMLPMVYHSHIAAAEHFMRMQEIPLRDGILPNAETRIELLEAGNQFARYRLSPITGKKHQLRVQMAALGLPLLNDQIYPHHVAAGEEDMSKPLQLLAKSIRFCDPMTGEMRHFESPRSLVLP